MRHTYIEADPLVMAGHELQAGIIGYGWTRVVEIGLGTRRLSGSTQLHIPSNIMPENFSLETFLKFMSNFGKCVLLS